MFNSNLNNGLTRANKDLIAFWATPDCENPTVLNGSLANGDNSITIAKASLIVAQTRQTFATAYISVRKIVDGQIHRLGQQYSDDTTEKCLSVSVVVSAGEYVLNHTGTGGIYNVYPLKGVE